VVSKTLKHFEESLEGYDFIRVHHSYYIHVTHVRKYVKQDGGQVLMSDGSMVPVSRRRKDELLQRLSAI
jgi:two-component system LytT family response regulator